MDYGEFKVFTANSEEWVIARDPEKTGAEWAQEHGRGYFGSANI